QNITLPPLGPSRRPSTTPPRITTASASQSMQFSRGFIGARWLVTDPNEDDMIYKVEIRGLNEREWKLVKEKVLDTFLSWDSTAYPDGEYMVRVTASDAPGNPPDKALESVIVSDRFTIDN